MYYRDAIRKHLDTLSHKDKVAYALHCAKDVLHLSKPSAMSQARKCVDLVERWLRGEKITREELRAAYAAAYAAAAADAAYAAYDAYAAADAAYAAYDAAAAYAAYAADAAYAAAYAAAAHAASSAAYAAAYAAYDAVDVDEIKVRIIRFGMAMLEEEIQ